MLLAGCWVSRSAVTIAFAALSAPELAASVSIALWLSALLLVFARAFLTQLGQRNVLLLVLVSTLGVAVLLEAITTASNVDERK